MSACGRERDPPVWHEQHPDPAPVAVHAGIFYRILARAAGTGPARQGVSDIVPPDHP